jgi:hypothetical protein
MLCSWEGIQTMGLVLLGSQIDAEKAEVQVRYLENRLRVSESASAYQLAEWHRSWWVMLPLGVIAGAALAIAAQLALGS